MLIFTVTIAISRSRPLRPVDEAASLWPYGADVVA